MMSLAAGCRDGVAALLLCASIFPRVARADDREVSRAQFHTDVQQMQRLVAACLAAQVDCDRYKVLSDEKVAASGASPGFLVHWDWLREAMEEARNPPKPATAEVKPLDRSALMREAAEQLATLVAESDAAQPAPEAQAFPQARATADDVLRAPEFQRKERPVTWWDRMQAKMYQWVGNIFDAFSRVGTAVPWLGTLLEWVFFLGAAAALVVLLLRNVQRQRLRMSLTDGAMEAAVWDREASDWADRATAFAREANWREAVHCLYWAAIVLLESRRAWRHNPTRTPREYVRLLKPGSVQQESLRGMTRTFEQVWYGLREANAAEYERAQEMYARLLETGGAISTTGNGAGTPVEAA
jgi:hypothetical protein